MKTRRGYPLECGALLCAGALACGPEGASSSGTETEASSGFPLETSTSEASGTESSTGTETATETEAGTDDPVPSCDYPGTICGEYLVCSCSCDFSADCCECVDTSCTLDEHCGADEVCVHIGAWFEPELDCVSASCDLPSSELPDIELYNAVDPYDGYPYTCVADLVVQETTWVEIEALAGVTYVHGDLRVAWNPALLGVEGLAGVEQAGALTITNNESLTSLAGLAALGSIGEGEITNNAALPTAEILAWLETVEGGESVLVCGNLDGDPC